MILVVAATARELAGAGTGVVTLACGIGPVEAAAATVTRACRRSGRMRCSTSESPVLAAFRSLSS